MYIFCIVVRTTSNDYGSRYNTMRTMTYLVCIFFPFYRSLSPIPPICSSSFIYFRYCTSIIFYFYWVPRQSTAFEARTSAVSVAVCIPREPYPPSYVSTPSLFWGVNDCLRVHTIKKLLIPAQCIAPLRGIRYV